MLRFISNDNVEDVIEHNTEPFVNEGGLGSSFIEKRGESAPRATDFGSGDYVIEDEYGRIWTTEFFQQCNGPFAGPPLSVMESFSNYGFLSVPFRQVPRRRVETREDLYRALAALDNAARRLYPKRQVVYRGQTGEYLISRDGNESELLFGTGTVLEPSLRPSATRRKSLSGTAHAVWSLLVQQHLARNNGYAPAHRFAETEDVWPHATALGEFIALAFAQHYGLPTPALDVTTDFGVALWFALHTLSGSGGDTKVGLASGGEGVVYVIAGGRGEYFGEDLPHLTAIRPRRQHGGFLASNWGNSKNRVARYLVGAVYFPHSILMEIVSELPTGEYLFPGPNEDSFVGLLQRVAWYERHGSEALTEIAAHVYWVHPADQSEANEINDGTSSNPNSDAEEAEKQWRLAAENNDPDSAAMLGVMLARRGDPEGELWTRRAAAEGQVDAMNNLGGIYERRHELAEAERWYRKAAEAGLIVGAYNLGTLLIRTGQRGEAERWLKIAAEGGDPDAACGLGKLLYERDEMTDAERWFQAGAEAGQAQSAYNLGQLCESQKNFKKAAYWFRVAAELGDPDAPYRLSRLEIPD